MEKTKQSLSYRTIIMKLKQYGKKSLSLFLGLLSYGLFAQRPIVSFEHITSDNGLPQNTILGIVKDKYGFMWFGTWNGLCRFDGYSFKTYRYDPKNKKSINNNRIQTIELDKNQNLLIGTFENDQLCRYSYEHDNFDRFDKNKNNASLFDWSDRRKHAESVRIRYKHFMWNIDLKTNFLTETDISTGKRKTYSKSSSNSEDLNDPHVTDIFKDNHNILWVGTYGSGINKANLNAKPFAHINHNSSVSESLIDKNVMTICEDKAGNIWVGTRDRGITIFGTKTRHIQKSTTSIHNNQIRAIFCASNGIVWIGTKEGLHSYNPATNVFRDVSKELDYKSVFNITEDKEHNLLIASWKGFYKYDIALNKFSHYNDAKLMIHPHSKVVIQDTNERIWVGCEGEGGATGGISLLIPIKNTNGFRLVKHFLHSENKNSISDNRINCIYEDKNGVIWIGNGNGLDKYDPLHDHFSNLSTNNQFPKSPVVAILEDNKGNLWISHKMGISRLNKKSLNVRTYTLQDGLQSNEFSCGAAFKSKTHNKMYFGGNNGFNIFNPDSILTEKTLPNTVLTDLEILNHRVGINEKVNGRVVLTKPLYLTKEIQLNNEDKIANGVRLGDGSTWSNSSNDKQWIAILDGQTGALKRYSAIPTDYIGTGPLACNLGIGYLNGTTPSIVAKFKNRNADKSFNLMVCAFKYTSSAATLQWKWLRGNTNAPDGHQIRIIDVDGNGTDEICDIGYCLNGDGTLRYELGSQGIVHGDRTQIGKLDPNRAGMQGYAVQQDNASGLLEYYYDASNGNIIWKHYGGIADVGRGTAADVDPTYSGFEAWSFSGLYNLASNTNIAATNPYPNFRIWWDGDLLSENLHDGKIEKWNYINATVSRLLTSWNYDNAVGSDRDAPLFYGDIAGDWREEVVMHNAAESQLVIFTTNTPTNTRLYTLAHNPAYRNCMTIKGYMQSHQADYFLGYGMSTPPTPNISYAAGTARFDTDSDKNLISGTETNSISLSDTNFSIYPNPISNNDINIKLHLDTQSDVTFTLTTIQGQKIFEKALGEIEKGNSTLTVNSTNNLLSGTYIATIRHNGETHSTKLIKK